MLTRYPYFKILFIFNVLLCSLNFETEIGRCHIQKSLNEKEIIEHIQTITNDLINEFGEIDNKETFHIKIIYSNKEWLEKFPDLDWAVGLAIKNQVFINNSKISNKKDLLETISHEICHIYQHRIKKSHTLPSWFKEGMAMYFSKEISINNNAISKSIWLRCLIDLKDLKNISSLDKSQINLAYQESRLAYKMIIDDFGSEAIKEIISEMNNNSSFDLAFKKITGINLNDFETKFNLKIINSDDRYIIFKQPMNWFFLSAIILIIIFIVVKFRNKKIIRKWEIEDELENLNENSSDNIDN